MNSWQKLSKRISKLLPFIKKYQMSEELALKIVECDFGDDEIEFDENLDIHEVEALVRDFFGFISDDFLKCYQNIRSFDYENVHIFDADTREEIKDLEIKLINKRYELGEITREQKEILIYEVKLDFDFNNRGPMVCYNMVSLPCTGSIRDAFDMVHEFTHKFYFQSCINSGESEDFLVEVLSIMMELLFFDYLIDRNIHKSDVLKYKKVYFSNLQEYAYYFLFDMLIIRIVREKGEINEDLLWEYIGEEREDLSDIFADIAEEAVEDMLESENLTFRMDNRYIVGVILASYLKESFLSTHDIDLLNKVGKAIYGNDLLNDLASCGLSYFDLETKKIDYDKLQEMLNCFYKEVYDLALMKVSL